MKQKIYLPTARQCAVLPVVTVVLLALANAGLIRQQFSSDAVSGAAAGYISILGRYLDSDVASTIGVFIFWLFVGAGAYALIGVIVLIVHPLITMAHLQQAVTRGSAKQVQQESHILLTRFILRTVAAAGLVILFAANLSFVLRFVDNAAIACIKSGNSIMGFSAVIVGTIDLFIFVFLTRLLVLRARLF